MPARLHVLTGPNKGSIVALQEGDTLIGRSTRAQLRLTSEEISVEHAAIRRDASDYTIENLSAHGTHVNAAPPAPPITGRVKLRVRDTIRLSNDTTVRFESADGIGLLPRPAILYSILGVLALAAAIVVILDPFTPRTPPQKWSQAQAALANWLDQEASAGRLPMDAPAVFREAWREDTGGDFADSQKAWARLRILLSGADSAQSRFVDADSHFPRALESVLTDPKATADLLAGQTPSTDPDFYAAAVWQFAAKRNEYATGKTTAQ